MKPITHTFHHSVPRRPPVRLRSLSIPETEAAVPFLVPAGAARSIDGANLWWHVRIARWDAYLERDGHAGDVVFADEHDRSVTVGLALVAARGELIDDAVDELALARPGFVDRGQAKRPSPGT